MLALPQATHTYYYYWSAWRTRVLMSRKEHHILRIWMDAPYATQKVKWELDQVSCWGGMPEWEATSGPASHIPPVLRTDRGQRRGQTALAFLELPKNHGSLEDCCNQASDRLMDGGMKVHEAALGSVLWPSDKHNLAGLARLSRTWSLG